MTLKMIIYSGNFQAAKEFRQTIEKLNYIGQTTETDADMFVIGYTAANMIVEYDGSEGPRELFSNNAIFLTALRVAVKNGLLPADAVTIKFFQCEPKVGLSTCNGLFTVDLDADGNFKQQPKGFMDTMEKLLLQLL